MEIAKSKNKCAKEPACKKSAWLKKFGAYGYILPIGLLLTSFYVIPIIMSIVLSFTKYNIMTSPKYIGFSNYTSLLKDRMFLASLKNTLLFTAVVVPVQTFLSLMMAVWLTGRKKSKIAEILKGVMFIPVISSMVLIGIVWRILLNGDFSPLNYLFTLAGMTPPSWLGSTNLALPTMMMIAVWKNVGYFMVIYIAGIMDIPRSYYEAANVDGASKWHEFWHITLPLLKPSTILVVFLGCIWSFQIFDLVYTLTGGGPGMATMTLVLHIYNVSFKQFNTGYAMAVANVLFFIIALISILQRKFLRKDQSSF
ncbi:multiple sugar transport system permease protein [Peptoclostridium litorale DSM 5388]|uniref:Binding--dependent transport system inner membrane component family protein n=1 Tax=Peptoclostridium litorale DSM 5388 TaxID=1121324 RepID=A0A069RNR1_PEPLI|nr:sugar ABC transporter permease [Peptoclostridium litorale]KDR95822.1 binding--dependent transport system inner membrane component family protein [Peptoclostridium litorale DSM 5388]SIO20635.1 multiple sugar transport system permease protein [Peptoclostridium litorale DSM 5388]